VLATLLTFYRKQMLKAALSNIVHELEENDGHCKRFERWA
jgi:hypothetical protein